MTAIILHPKFPNAPRSFTGSEPAAVVDDHILVGVEAGMKEAVLQLHEEQLILHCVKAKQLIDAVAAQYRGDA